ncbi:hypothetical protein GO491_04435 [Flavobacteriaceae bacterium Ap0902]|nr:hypothetical protein [Flavobacteriaceae bacterium Ap0902]
MRKFFQLNFFLFCIGLYGQSDSVILDFQVLRQYDEVHIPESENLYQELKQITIGDDVTLLWGGSYRIKAEMYHSQMFNNVPQKVESWLNHRGMLHGHLKIKDKFQLYAELNTSLVTDKDNLSPIDKDELSFTQLFASFNMNQHWNALLGRQTIMLGAGRLLDIREGPNVRFSMDMAQLQYHQENTNIITFYGRPVQPSFGVFDNKIWNNKQQISSIYWTQDWSEKTHTDLYVIHKDEKQKKFAAGIADDKRTSLGIRSFGNWNGVNYDNEFIYQLGTFGNQDISAWQLSFFLNKDVHIGRKWNVGLKANIISGNKKSNNSLNTFDSHYARGSYTGSIGYFGLSNLIQFHPSIGTNFGKLNIDLDYAIFWRYSVDDGIYNPGTRLTFEKDSDEKFIANQIGLDATYPINNFIDIIFESNMVIPDEYLKTNGYTKDLFYAQLSAQFKF